MANSAGRATAGTVGEQFGDSLKTALGPYLDHCVATEFVNPFVALLVVEFLHPAVGEQPAVPDDRITGLEALIGLAGTVAVRLPELSVAAAPGEKKLPDALA